MAKKTSPKPTNAVENETLGIILSYLGVLVLIPYFFFKKTVTLQFHTRQGLALFIIEAAIYAIHWFLPWSMMGILYNLLSLLSLVVFVAGIVAMIQGLNGKQWEIPYVCELTQKLP